MLRTLPFSLLVLTFPVAVSANIDLPECDALAAWAKSFTPPEARSRDGAVPALFQDEAFASLFGKPVAQWEDEDFRSLDRHMKECQRKLFKGDRQGAERLNEVRRYLPAVKRSVAQAGDGQASQAVATLLALPPSPKADHMLEEAASLLRQDKTFSRERGRDPASNAVQTLARSMATLPPADAQALLRQIEQRQEEAPSQQAVAEPQEVDQVDEDAGVQEAEAERERQARVAEQLAQQFQTLKNYRFEELADLGQYLRRLQYVNRTLREPRNSEAAAASGISRHDVEPLYPRFLAAVEQLKPEFLDYLAGLPETAAGLQQARRAVAAETGIRYADDVMADYLAAAEQRAEEIQAALDHARDYFDVSSRVDTLLPGEGSRASLGKLTPGMQTEAAIRLADAQWGYRNTSPGGLEIVLAPARQTMAEYRKAQRDGGRITLRELEQEVGQIEYFEHYRAKMELDALRQQLVGKFGEPDSARESEHGVRWSWVQGDQRLQVEAKNQVDVIMHGAGFRSRLAVALWNQDYEDYLEEANRRCDRIREKPQNERSMEDGIFFMKHHCPLTEGHRLKPGLEE